MGLGRLRQKWFAQTSARADAPEFALPAGVRVYAVGDIHGRSDLLAKMLTAIRDDARANPAPRIIEVFLGDYIDRGMQSREVVGMLLEPPPEGHERICLRGNHEATLLQFLATPNILREWGNFGGYATLASYGIAIPGSMSPESLTAVRDRLKQNLPNSHQTFFANLRTTYSLGDYLFVHAGINPKRSLEAQSEDDLLWIRDPFLNYKGFFAQYVVHGHSPVAAPEIHANRANLDVSGASQDSLCCLVAETTQRRVLLVTAAS